MSKKKSDHCLSTWKIKLSITNVNYICKDQIWVPGPKGGWTQAQQAQNNEFVESGLENWAKMSWTTNKVGSNDKNRKIYGFKVKKIVLSKVRGDQFLYISHKFDYKFDSWLLQCFSLDFSSFCLRVFSLIYTTSFFSHLPYM